jgi:hypothetical protein
MSNLSEDKYYQKYIKYKNKYLLYKQIAGYINYTDVNHILYNKIKEGASIEEERNKLTEQFKKCKKDNKYLNSEGFLSWEIYLIISQVNTINEIEKNNNFKYEDIVIAGDVWTKLYFTFLMKKYKNDNKKVIEILKKEKQ